MISEVIVETGRRQRRPRTATAGRSSRRPGDGIRRPGDGVRRTGAGAWLQQGDGARKPGGGRINL